jgi:cytochrome c553
MKETNTTFLGWLMGLGHAALNLGRTIKSLLGPSPGWAGLKRWVLQITTLGLLLGGGGFLVAALGLIPIKASSGHWQITAWFLHFTMIRSVSTQSMGIEVPALNEPGMVLKGATHYATGCSPCHGDPSNEHPRIAMQMTPHPPYLPPIVNQWEPQELFYIVKHGVKFTGMPAWPAQDRDDEVWAIVAFLQKFPDLNEEEYRRMVDGEVPPGSSPPQFQSLGGRNDVDQSLIASCDRCHGPQGQGRGAGVAPKLAGQKRQYLEASLVAFSKQQRHSGIMEPVSVALSTKEINELAKFYSEIKPLPVPLNDSDLQSISRGAAIAQDGVLGKRIPICSQCHGPTDDARNPGYPNLAGQYAEYLSSQLDLFGKEHRGGTKFQAVMEPVAHRLTEEQIRDVANYYQSIGQATSP